MKQYEQPKIIVIQPDENDAPADLSSLPPSVQRHFAPAMDLGDMGQRHGAMLQMQDAAAALAANDPRALVALLGAQMGAPAVAEEEMVTETVTDTFESRMLGIKVFSDRRTVVKNKVRSHRHRLGG
jgi:hypothetical protein